MKHAHVIAFGADQAGTKRRRKPRARKGSEWNEYKSRDGKIVFAHLSTHVNRILPDGSVRLERIDRKPEKQLKKWPELLAARLAVAKSAVLSYEYEPDKAGIPDPRGPSLKKGEVVIAKPGQLMIQSGRTIRVEGRGDAHPGVIRSHMAAKGAPIPNDLTDDHLTWLVRLVSIDSGGMGQISPKALARLLCSPRLLSPFLMKHAYPTKRRANKDGTPQERGDAPKRLLALAAGLPRSKRW